MNLRTLLERLRLLDPKPDGIEALARVSTDRLGVVNRRAFLGLAGATVAALAIDPELLVWTPGEQTIVVPEALEVAAYGNRFVSPEWLTREVLKHLKHQVQFSQQVFQRYDAAYETRLGDTVRVPHPARYSRTRRGPFEPDTPSEPVTLAHQFTVQVDADAIAEDLRHGATPEHISQRHAAPAAAMLANETAFRGIDVLGVLPLPYPGPGIAHGVLVQSDGVAVRGLAYTDSTTEKSFFRFDIIGGSSKAAQRRVQQRRPGTWVHA